MATYKWGVVNTLSKTEQAEKKLYAQALRKIIGLRGRANLLQFPNGQNENDFLEVPSGSLTDDDIRPDSGFFIFGHKPPGKGGLQKSNGRTSAITKFYETVDNRWVTRLKVEWTSDAYIPKNAITPPEASALGAIEVEGENLYYIKNFPFDFNDVFNQFVWDEVLDAPPELKYTEPDNI